MIVVFEGLQKAETAIKRLQQALRSDGPAKRIGLALAHAGLDSVRSLTPRQKNPYDRRGSTKRGHEALFKGWVMQYAESHVRESVFEAVISNKAASTPGGVVVLSSVEHGARRHDMFGVFGWFETRSGVRARSAFSEGRRVELPGGRASELSSRATVDVRFAVARETGWVNVGTEEAPGHIDHPGSPAAHMVAHTKEHMRGIVGVFISRLEAEYRNAFNIGVQ